MLDIVPGRSLAASVSWEPDDAKILFDRNSGDYWVVSPLAHGVVGQIMSTGPEDPATLARRLADEANDFEAAETAVMAVIRELVQREILTDA